MKRFNIYNFLFGLQDLESLDTTSKLRFEPIFQDDIEYYYNKYLGYKDYRCSKARLEQLVRAKNKALDKLGE